MLYCYYGKNFNKLNSNFFLDKIFKLSITILFNFPKKYCDSFIFLNTYFNNNIDFSYSKYLNSLIFWNLKKLISNNRYLDCSFFNIKYYCKRVSFYLKNLKNKNFFYFIFFFRFNNLFFNNTLSKNFYSLRSFFFFNNFFNLEKDINLYYRLHLISK